MTQTAPAGVTAETTTMTAPNTSGNSRPADNVASRRRSLSTTPLGELIQLTKRMLWFVVSPKNEADGYGTKKSIDQNRTF